MTVQSFSFGQIKIDNKIFKEDIIIINKKGKSKILLRNKNPSRRFKSQFGHTPLTVYENIDWDCDTIIVGTGVYGSMPVTNEFKKEVALRKKKLHIFKTQDAINYINMDNSCIILHISC